MAKSYVRLEREGKQKKEDGRDSCKGLVISYAGVAFCVLFIAQSLAQNLFTTLYPGIAFKGWAIIMFVIGVVSLFTPFIQSKLGIRFSLFVGAMAHPIFIGSLATGSEWMILASCAILGFGGALLWVTHGVYIATVCDGENVGKMSGIFWLIFNTNLIIGTFGLSALYFFGINVDLSMIPAYMTVVGLIGAFMILGVKIPKSEKNTKGPEDSKGFLVSLKEETLRTRDTLLLCLDPRMLLLSFLFILQGTTASFIYGLMPLLVDSSNVSQLFLCFGIAKTLASFASGYVYDRFGWTFLIAGNFIINLTAYAIIGLGVETGSLNCIFGASALLGSAEALFLILIAGTIMDLWQVDSAPPFAAYRFLNSLAGGAGFLISPMISWMALAIFNAVAVIATTVCFVVLYKVVLKKSEFQMYQSCDKDQEKGIEMEEECIGGS
eukprot:TRINITY_DN15047_c0_g1_i1.p1 TRINITY_DN15047_c0_g1~~TRINITY_DN15047_c0_g1_i1.p1  ORF type:complete len:437 (+),score=128.77 TRINITY_DN15047_c0_g1_i1:79-1389(+)